ncbi:AAA family ATPase [bacterium]|nr:AAA family ATPase [bacterium]
MIIIGITGTIGAGKGTIVEYLTKQKGFKHFSVRAYLLEEIKKRGLPENRDSMVLVANDLRANNSPSFISDELFKQAQSSGQDCIIESIRTLGEIESLRKQNGFYLFAVDADSKIRYERVILRKSETDQISLETFLANEEREMSSEDPNKQNLRKCIEMADFVFNNDGSFEEFNNKVEKVIDGIKNEN